jgi:hypothetical protein
MPGCRINCSIGRDTMRTPVRGRVERRSCLVKVVPGEEKAGLKPYGDPDNDGKAFRRGFSRLAGAAVDLMDWRGDLWGW